MTRPTKEQFIDFAGDEPEEHFDLLGRLRAYADRQYCLGIEQLRRNECLGWEHKLKTGKFGEAEMKAHENANRHFGAHFGIYAAIRSAKVTP